MVIHIIKSTRNSGKFGLNANTYCSKDFNLYTKEELTHSICTVTCPDCTREYIKYNLERMLNGCMKNGVNFDSILNNLKDEQKNLRHYYEIKP